MNFFFVKFEGSVDSLEVSRRIRRCPDGGALLAAPHRILHSSRRHFFNFNSFFSIFFPTLPSPHSFIPPSLLLSILLLSPCICWSWSYFGCWSCCCCCCSQTCRFVLQLQAAEVQRISCKWEESCLCFISLVVLKHGL